MLQESGNNNEVLHAAELEAAFSSFNQASSSLAEIYRDLESRVSTLTSELYNTRIERTKEFDERERIAKRLGNILRVLPAGVILLDGNGCVTEQNPAAEELLGANVVEQNWSRVVERSFCPRWDDGHDITLRDGRRVNLSTQSLGNESGQLILLVDVTDNRNMQSQLERLKHLSALGDMASALAHQIRTPLSSALLYASNMLNLSMDESTRCRFHEKLIGRLQHLESLVKDMMLFARGRSLEGECVSIKNLFSEFVESAESQIESTDSKLTLDIQCPHLCINANPAAFLSVLQNLLDNAIQAGGEGTQVEVAVKQSGKDEVRISFSDNGPGLDEQTGKKYSNRFLQHEHKAVVLGLPL